ncbi:DNA/RNA non-specific endonuclease [Acidovorax sp. Be4]|uniref:DNA/RNA non-specific endonuclease n=1 Tax=Acidovorax bellezanensis TaxID=2976702 RepID=A0ABT2PR24_9BURK|nr:DNA/RNA non-specific endonuclease [Acidovorax sp. Be4]MCT9812326.1 DNA/RNA non-specific endonuclease [Acidovorax sp. Be4]
MRLHLSASLVALALAGCTLLPAPPPLARVDAAFAECPQFFPEGKPPLVPDAPQLRELCYSAFAILHSGQTKTPVFVAEHLDRAMIERAHGQKRSEHFFADARLPAAERSELADYRGSGYSRGHMAPAGDMSTPTAMAQSFSLANMVPQNQPFNAGAWSEIEHSTRQYVLRAQADVYVFTGPVFAADAPTIGPGKVQVPSHLFKLVYDPCSGKSWAHWLANAATTRPLPPISYDELVRRTGIRFLPPAPPSNQAAAGCGRREALDGLSADVKKPRLHVQSGF